MQTTPSPITNAHTLTQYTQRQNKTIKITSLTSPWTFMYRIIQVFFFLNVNVLKRHQGTENCHFSDGLLAHSSLHAAAQHVGPPLKVLQCQVLCLLHGHIKEGREQRLNRSCAAERRLLIRLRWWQSGFFFPITALICLPKKPH